MKGSQQPRVWGFTLIEILVVVAILILIAAILLPELARSRARVSKASCSNHLGQIGLAFRMWAMDNTDQFPMAVSVTNGGTQELVTDGKVFPHFLVMSNELSTPKLLACPEDPNPARTIADTFSRVAPPGSGQIPFTNDNNVSYFVGVEASEMQPDMLLAGESNFGAAGVATKPGLYRFQTNSTVTWLKPRHENGGNIGFADGSVQRVSNQDWPALLFKTGRATNCLAMP